MRKNESGGTAGRALAAACRAAITVTPGPLLTSIVARSIRRSVRRGERKLIEGGRLSRALHGIASPFTSITLQMGPKIVTFRLLPWLVWFRGSFYCRVLSRDDMIGISGCFSEKTGLRIIIPSGPSLPVGFRAGTLVEVTGSALEWLVDRFLITY